MTCKSVKGDAHKKLSRKKAEYDVGLILLLTVVLI